MAIRWRKKDTDELTRLVRNYNAKIMRLKKKGYKEDLLPERLTLKKVKSRITNRSDYKTEVELMKVFTARYSENINKMSRGAEIPTFAMKQSKIKIDVINKKRRDERKKLENFQVTDRNQKLGVKVRDYKQGDLQQYEPRNFRPKNMSKKDFEIFQKTLVEYEKTMEQKNSRYVENFYKSIHNVFGLHLGEEYEQELLDILKDISDEDIVFKYYTDINMNIKLHYDDLELESRFEIVRDAWKEFADKRKSVRK